MASSMSSWMTRATAVCVAIRKIRSLGTINVLPLTAKTLAKRHSPQSGRAVLLLWRMVRPVQRGWRTINYSCPDARSGTGGMLAGGAVFPRLSGGAGDSRHSLCDMACFLFLLFNRLHRWTTVGALHNDFFILRADTTDANFAFIGLDFLHLQLLRKPVITGTSAPKVCQTYSTRLAKAVNQTAAMTWRDAEYLGSLARTQVTFNDIRNLTNFLNGAGSRVRVNSGCPSFQRCWDKPH